MQTVPISKLRVGAANVRFDQELDENLGRLIASIQRHGLLQPLVVTPAGDDGTHEVIAGRRRLEALNRLNPNTPDVEIPVVVVAADQAVEASLAENYAREQMRPPQVYRAFAQVIEANPDTTEQQLGAMFDLELDVVRRTLRLGRLHPDVFTAYLKGELSDDQARAFAATEDQELQASILPNVQHHTAASQIRGMLGSTKGDLKLRVVGVDAYQEAGGRFERDLFQTDDPTAGRVLDPELLDQLANTKLCNEIAERFGGDDSIKLSFAAPLDRYGYADHNLQLRPMKAYPEEIAARISQIDLRVGQLDDWINGFIGDETVPEGVADENAAEAEIEKLQAERNGYVPTLLLPAGRKIAVPQLARKSYDDPTPELTFTVYWADKDAMKDALAAQKAIEKAEGKEPTKAKDGPAASTISERARHYMKDMRHAAIARGIFDADTDGERAAQAHNALIFAMARGFFTHTSRETGMVFGTSGDQHRYAEYDPKLTAFDGEWLSEPDSIKAFNLFCELTPQQINQVAARMFAMKVEAATYQPGRRTVPEYLSTLRAEPFMARRVYDLDADFFALFRKKDIIGFFEEALGAKLSDTFRAKLNKAKQESLRQYAMQCFNPDDHPNTIKLLGLTPHTKLLRDWIPSWLRFDDVGVFYPKQTAAKPKAKVKREAKKKVSANAEPEIAEA